MVCSIPFPSICVCLLKATAFNSSHSLTLSQGWTVKESLDWSLYCGLQSSSACPCSWPGPLVLVGLHDTSLSDHRTSHGGGEESWELGIIQLKGARLFSAQCCSTQLAAVAVPVQVWHPHKHKKAHLRLTTQAPVNKSEKEHKHSIKWFGSFGKKKKGGKYKCHYAWTAF